MVAKTRAGGQGTPRKLKFNEKLAGKGLSTDALLKKLKSLHSELAEMDQELVDVASLGAVRKELINTSILLHKDRGVKAYAACCLADILRLYAPDAPYTHTELRDIFQFFFRQLTSGLQGADCAYYNEYFHLLESLSTVKSVVLVCDLPNADALMVDVFRAFFGIVRRDLPKKMELFMADILVALIDESQSLPSEVLEAIMAQFMDKNTRMDQPAYRLAVQVCNATADKLQRHVCQYFSDIIISHSRDEDLDEVRSAHDLIKQLNHSCPSLLHNVVPQLEEELRVEMVPLRLLVTQVLGEMFSDDSGMDLVKKYPSTWNFWLLRKNDRVAAVRLALVDATKGLISKPPEIHKPVEETLQLKLLDPDEKVRAAVCKVYGQLDYETVLHHVSEEQLRLLAGRGADKKHSVRVEALNSLGRLYSLAYPEIESNDPKAVEHFSWIPGAILHMLQVGTEVRAVAEQVLVEHILPLPSPAASSSKVNDIDEVAWVNRLLTTMKFLDEGTVNALLAVSGLKNARPSIYDKYLQSCIEYNGGTMDEDEEAITAKLNNTIQKIARQSPDPQKVAEDLHAFANLNEGRLYKLLGTCMDTQTDLKGLIKATNEFLRRVDQSSSSLSPTIAVLVRRTSLRLVNQSSIPTLVRAMQKYPRDDDIDESNDTQVSSRHARTVLTYISKHCPAIYKPHIGELTKAIADEKNPRLVEVCLQALAAVATWDDKLCPHDKRTTERIMRFVRQSNHRHAKFAARLLACSKDREELCEQVVTLIATELPQADSDTLLAHVAVLAEFAAKAPDAFEHRSDVVMAFLLKHVLMAPCALDPNRNEMENEWVPDARLTPLLRTKLLCIKICRNRCLAHATSEAALDIASPVLKMLVTLIQHEGSFQPNTDDDPRVKSRLRLQAATSLLQLSSIPTYANAIVPSFVLLALIVQDSCFQVRLAFLKKLVGMLTAHKLPSRYNVIPFLTALDPDNEIPRTSKAYVSYVIRALPPALRLEHFELLFIRYLHLLAHHPDFSKEHGSLEDIARYIEFYLDLVCSRDNISLLYHLSMKAKTVRDAESSAFSENLYITSELAQEIIKARSQSQSWNLESYPGKIKLPSDILRPLPTAEVANKILKTSYLPAETSAWLAERAMKSIPHAKEKTRPVEKKTQTKRKAAPKTNGNSKRHKAQNGRRDAEEEEEEEESSAESDQDDDDEEMASAEELVVDDNPKVEERLGRSARTKAKAKIRQQTKKRPKGKSDHVTSSDD